MRRAQMCSRASGTTRLSTSGRGSGPFGGGIVVRMSPRAVSSRRRGPSPDLRAPFPTGGGIRRMRLPGCPLHPIAPDDAWAADEIHEDARDRQRLRLCEPLRPAGPGGPRGAGGRGQRPAFRDRLRRPDPDRPLRARRRPDADVQRRRLRVGDVRQRRAVRRQVPLRSRPGAEGSGDGRDGQGGPDARPGSRGGEGPPRPRRHGRADPAGRRHPDHARRATLRSGSPCGCSGANSS